MRVFSRGGSAARCASWGRWDVLAIGAATLAVAFVGQDANANSVSHLALVRALASGTAIVDETMYETGNIVTHDVVERRGHVYSNKAPGLAFVTLPTYVAVDAVGTRTTGDPTFLLWALGLAGVVVPAFVAMLIVRGFAERLNPGSGTATAVTLSLGTLLLPFGTLFFSHVLSACLCIAAFALLWLERDRGPRRALVLAAGFLAGFAVTTEYPNGLVAIVLGVYALGRSERLQRALTYSGGFLLGLVPLLLYNTWAFGNPAQLSYGTRKPLDEYVVTEAPPFRPFGLGLPGFGRSVEILFTYWGLLWAAPVLALGGFGVFLLYRRGHRAEAAVVGALAALFVVYNSAFWGPIGGGLAGTRYLIPILPFLALPLALAYGRLPLTTGALAVVSVGTMTLMTATGPAIAWDGRVLERLTAADGSSPTVADFLGVTGWYDIVPFYAASLVAVTAATASTRTRFELREAPVAVVALVGWSMVAIAGVRLLSGSVIGGHADALLVLLLGAAAVAATAGTWWVSRLQLSGPPLPEG